MALLQQLWSRPKHRADVPVRCDRDLSYVPAHCWFAGTSACTGHNHPGDGGYGKPAAHWVVGGAA